MASSNVFYDGPLVTRNEARAGGLSRYFTGAPCEHGHIAQRMTSSQQCHRCLSLATKERNHSADYKAKKNVKRNAARAADPDAFRARGRVYYARNADKIAADMRDYRREHPDLVKASKRRSYEKNYDKIIARNLDWQRRNPEKRRAQGQRYRANHAEQITARIIAWVAANPDRIAGIRRRSRVRHKDKIAATSRAYRAAHRALYSAATKRWCKANPDAKRTLDKARKHRKRSASGAWTRVDIERIYKQQRGRCAICRKRLGKIFSIDHVNPLARTGTNFPHNLQLSHQSCNARKSDKDPIAFMQSLGFLI